MSAPQIFASLFKSAPSLVRMLISLFWTYLTLGRQVRKARKAFEGQLILQGMSKDDAQRLGVCYDELKESILTAMKQGMSWGFKQQAQSRSARTTGAAGLRQTFLTNAEE